jgi:hypothetical protein
MIHVSLRRWSGQFHIPGVVGKIRRVIEAYLARDHCVCVYDDGARGITPEVRRAIESGMPGEKVRFSRVHPVLGGLPPPFRRHHRQ